MGHRCVPAPFLTKTYQMIEDPSTDDVISWNEMGITFVVWKPVDFARDLLPKYFKHNNFSSFVRQLNTYGFRKIVPDKWEFANEYFKQGEKDLLSEIHRRKAVPISTIQANAGGKSNGRAGGHSSQSNSGEDLGSTSTSSPDPKNQVLDGTTTIIQFSDLSVENEKLRKDNKILSTELAKTKQQCEEVIAFLSKYLNVAPDYINRIMMQGSIGPSSHDRFVDTCDNVDDVDDDDEKGRDEEEKECLKLFGVWLKGKKRCPTTDIGGPPVKEMKMMGFHTPWMKMFCSPSRGKSSKVCN